jgi:DNA-directed RNA polymerase specialized sigma24 family protein
MDELQQLITTAQAHPDRSPQRRIALTKLMTAISKSDRITRQTNWATIPNFKDIYNEALNETLIEICRRIDNYNPQYPVMAWVNNIFNYRFQDVYIKYRKKGVTNLPKQEQLNWLNLDRPTHSREDKQQEPSSAAVDCDDEDFELLKNFIAADPDRVLAAEYIQGHPDATFQTILLMICAAKSWTDISAHFGISISTLSSFYRRRVHKFLPYFQKHLQ